MKETKDESNILSAAAIMFDKEDYSAEIQDIKDRVDALEKSVRCLFRIVKCPHVTITETED